MTMSAPHEPAATSDVVQSVDSVIDHARAAVFIGASFGASAMLTFGMLFA